MKAHKLTGLLRYAEETDDVIIVVDGYEHELTAIEIDESIGVLYLKGTAYEEEASDADDDAELSSNDPKSLESNETVVLEA